MNTHYIYKPEGIDRIALSHISDNGWDSVETPNEILKKGDVFAFDIDGTRYYAECTQMKVTWGKFGKIFSYLLERMADDKIPDYLRDIGIEKVIENRKHADKLRQIAKKLQMYDCLKTTAIPEILRLADEYEGVKH